MGGVYFLKFFKVIFHLLAFEKLHHSLFYMSILFLTFFSSTMFQMHLWFSRLIHKAIKIIGFTADLVVLV